MRCALVEFNECHGEILPTFVYLLNRLGIVPDVYLRRHLIESEPFALCPDLKLQVHDLESSLVRAEVRLRRFARYGVVIACSAEPLPALRRIDRARPPVIAVVHNAVLMDSDRSFRTFFEDSKHQPLGLGPHILMSTNRASANRWVAPVYVMPDPASVAFRPDSFCVQGRLDLRRRNYSSLLDAIEQLSSTCDAELEVRLVGGEYELDGARFRRSIRQRGLERFFSIDTEWHSYARSIEAVAASEFVLPLVDTTSIAFAPYFEDKISSSLSMAIGLSRIPVVHHRLAVLYGLEGCAVTYRDGDLAAAMSRAMRLSTKQHLEMAQRLTQVRLELLESSLGHLAAALRDAEVPLRC